MILNSPIGLLSMVAALLPDTDLQMLHDTGRALSREATGVTGFCPTETERTQVVDTVRAQIDAAIEEPRDLSRAAELLDRLEHTAMSGADFHVCGMLLGRLRQQQVVAAAPGLVRLTNPGSQSAAYDCGPDGRPARVWYASYGSNLRRARMDIYIHGGSVPGSDIVYTGARSKAPIAASVAISLPGTVHYAGESALWGGGVAFLDTAAPGRSLGRAHLITAEQFDDVVFQESHGAVPPDGTPVDLVTTLRAGRCRGAGLYGNLVHIGDYQCAPVVTFTSSFTTAQALRGDLLVTAEGTMAQAAGREAIQTVQSQSRLLEEAAAAAEGRIPAPVRQDWPVYTSAPSTAYRDMIASGLTETHGLDAAQCEAYFAGATGTGVVSPVPVALEVAVVA